MEKILLVEDDKTIASGLEYSLQQEGYGVILAGSVAEAIRCVEKETYQLCLLDLTLPDGTGYEVCKKMKEMGDTPVIFLTACDDEVNVVMGLDMGADDYITKPFRIRELISRIRMVLRRVSKSGENRDVVVMGNISIHKAEAKVYKEGKEVVLTALEYRLLLVFLNHRGQVLSRNQLLEGIWDVSGDFVNDNTLTVYIKRLREKLETNPKEPVFIKTVRGLGYILE